MVVFTKTLSREMWLLFSSRTSARKRMSSALASPSTGGAAMATSTASAETAVTGRDSDKQQDGAEAWLVRAVWG